MDLKEKWVGLIMDVELHLPSVWQVWNLKIMDPFGMQDYQSVETNGVFSPLFLQGTIPIGRHE